MDEAALLQHIRTLVEAQLVVEESPGQFAFRHALAREAVYNSLLVRERKRYHATIAGRLERAYAGALDAHLADLAHHYYEAGAWEKALEFGRLAGAQAQGHYAPREATVLFGRALEAARQLGQAPPPELLRARGRGYETLGEFEHARADYEQALESARRGEDRHAEWETLLDLGFLWAAEDYRETGEYFASALELARTLADPATLAHTLNRVGNWHVNVEHMPEALQHHQEALGIFRQLDDRQGLAETLDLLGLSHSMGGDGSAAERYYRQAVDLFRELDDPRGLAGSLATLGELGCIYFVSAAVAPVLTLSECLQVEMSALERARRIGWRAGEAYVSTILGMLHGSLGHYDRALDHGVQGLQIAQEIGHRQWLIFANLGLGALYADLLAFAPAQQHLERALDLARQANAPFWIENAAAFLAALYAGENDLARAAAVLEAVWRPDLPADTIGRRQCWVARLQLALAQHAAGEALEIADRLQAALTPVAGQGSAIAWPPRLLLFYGEALAARGEYDHAEERLKCALEITQAHGARSLQWRCHAALGRLSRSHGDLAAAKGQFAAQRALVEELAARVPDPALRANYLARALVEGSADPSLS